MNKKVVALLALILVIIVIGIIVGVNLAGNNENTSTVQNQVSNENETGNEEIAQTTYNGTNTTEEQQNNQESGNGNVEVSMENERIKLTVNENEIFVRLDDNVASREFLEMLPLTLTFEDFNNTEKIATLPSELSTEGLPFGYTPEVGDFSYYAPWGNVSVFYEDFRYSNSLYKLGTIESGTEILENMNGDFEVTIERVD